MTTILTTFLFMTFFKKIEGVKIDTDVFWSLVLAFCSLFFSSLYWTALLGTHVYLTIRALFYGDFQCFLALLAVSIVPYLLRGRIQKHLSAIKTAPLRVVSSLFPHRLSFDSDKGAESLSTYIFVLSIGFIFLIG